jgi:hypothetical protein
MSEAKIRELSGGQLENPAITVYQHRPAWKCKCKSCGKIAYVDTQSYALLKGCRCVKPLWDSVQREMSAFRR